VSLGLPVHVAPYAVSHAMVRALHVMAAVLLVTAFLFVGLYQAVSPRQILWPAMVALVVFGVALWFADRTISWLTTIAYLVVGAACLYWYTVTGAAQVTIGGSTDNYAISIVKVALVLVGGVGVSALSTFAWAGIGWMLAEGVTMLAALQTGLLIVFDPTTAVTFGVILLVRGAIGINLFRVRFAKPSLHRAARDEYIAHMRHRAEVKAAAMLHDTVLNHLAAIGTSPDGPLRHELRAQVASDLEVLIGQEWLLDASEESSPASDEWQVSRLATAIVEAQQLGLKVEVSGDLTALARADSERATAVALAVKQCLVNVVKHAGVDHAEIVIFGSDDELSVMVIDAGRGFDVAATARDRLGLRHSVQTRIESVGGGVQVWSNPGHGTSVLLRVPTVAQASIS
jgi:signal transduction histidine kinase